MLGLHDLLGGFRVVSCSRGSDAAASSSSGSGPSIPTVEKLDPITVLVLAALLQFKEKGSRLTYSNKFEVFIQQPGDYTVGICLLPAVRGLKGQTHDDVGIVGPAIDKVARWHKPHLPDQAVYKALFEWAIGGLNALKRTYEEKGLILTVSGINDLTSKLTSLSLPPLAEGSVPHEVILEGKEKEVAALWTKDDIGRINSLFSQMVAKQGATSIDEKVLCGDEIGQIEYMLYQKLPQLQFIWEDA